MNTFHVKEIEPFHSHDLLSTLQEEKYHTSSIWSFSLNILILRAKHKAKAQTYITGKLQTSSSQKSHFE